MAKTKVPIKRSVRKKPGTFPKVTPALAPDGKVLSQASAVQGNVEMKIGEFKIKAAPNEFRKELFGNEANKRFHGNKVLMSWIPLEWFENNTDHFGYMFPKLRRTALDYSLNVDRLKRLGEEIGSKESGPSAGGDSTIPAGYTYLGQFIDHDITLDVSSDLGRLQDANDIPNMRSPSLDLDAVYGLGPAVNPFLYDHSAALGPAQGVKLLLGRNSNSGDGGPSRRAGGFGNPSLIGNNFDVQRTSDFSAIIGDPRNDENLIVSQLHHAFLKFHNKVVDKLVNDSFSGDLFTQAQRIVVHHYQWVVAHDFLKRIANPTIVDQTLRRRTFRFFKSKKLFMPVEFSVAAYRFGHSMIRNGYFVNAPLSGQLPNKAASLAEVFSFIRPGRLPVFSNWVIDWNLYFPGHPAPAANGTKFNNARKIDTRLALGLNSLPDTPDTFLKVLAKRNLVRALALGLPSGQAVAKQIGATTLTEAELTNGNSTAENAILQESNKLLLKQTPLWYYILKEAEVKENGNRLGEVGSTIVAETFVKLLRSDRNSYLNATPAFRPTLPRFNARPVGDFDMTDILNFAGVLTLD